MSELEENTSIVEATLRSQREVWQEIYERVSRLSSRDLSPEPPKRILLFGVGSSHFAAKLAGFALLRDRSRNRLPVVSCSSLAIGSEVFPGKGDWAFGISHRGKTFATMKALETCARSGAFAVLVGAQGLTPPAECGFFLPTSPLETVEPHTVAMTGAICAITSLLLGPRGIEEWDALRSIGVPDLETLRRRAGDGPSILLGEWEGEWLAREGALKLMEMAGVPVRVFGSEEFFHGPRFSRRPEERIWHVSMPRDSRNSEIDAVLSVTVSGSSPLAWMPALVELQWLALAVALNRGRNPDQPGE